MIVRNYKTSWRLWFVLALISFIIIGVIPLFSFKGVPVSLGLWLWGIVTAVLPSLFSGQIGFLEAGFDVLILFVWLVVAVIIGWLLQGVVIIVRDWKHERSRRSA